MLCIDFGHHSIKAAAWIAGELQPQPFPKSGGGMEPAVGYVPRNGAVTVGQTAYDMAKRDPGGAVGHLRAALTKSANLMRNRRAISARDLAATYFDNARRKTSQFKPADSCALIVPATIHQAQIDALEAAARLGGFSQVSLIYTPLAVCEHWYTYSREPIDRYCVLDLGAARTELNLVIRKRGAFFLDHRWTVEPRIGYEAIEGYLYDMVLGKQTERQANQTGFHLLREYLTQVKQSWARSQCLPSCESVIGFELSAHEVEQAFQTYRSEALSILHEIEDLSNDSRSGSLALIVAGGGAMQTAIEVAIRAEGWQHPIYVAQSPQFAAALGGARLAGKLEQSRNPDGLLAKQHASTRFTRSDNLRNGEGLIQCNEIDCGTANEPSRTYCYRCGSPLPTAWNE